MHFRTFALNQGPNLFHHVWLCLIGFKVEHAPGGAAPRLLPQPGQHGGHLHLLAAAQELLAEPPAVVAIHQLLLQVHRAPGLDPEDLLGDEGSVSLLEGFPDTPMCPKDLKA